MKKQAKPELFLDHYLSTLGLWRKPIARDGFCLFRAVSEQLFKTQAYFRHLYEACRVFFTLLGKTPELEWNENEVMQILSRMYRRDFLVYEIVGHPPYPATCNSYDKKIILVRIDENHLDSVYPGNFVQSAAICQSIIYEVLYKGVFKLDSELTEAVTLIRDQNKKKFGIGLDGSPVTKCGSWHSSPRDRYLRRATPPVPYRIAKALDPNIYRNVELDIWEEEKRELLKESAVYKERFAPGDKCQVLLEGEHYHGHIQELRPDDDAVIVFIEELGEKKTVAYTCLKSPPRHSTHSGCMVHRYYRRKQDMPVSSQSPPPSYQGNCSTPTSTTQAQIYVPGMRYTPNGMLTAVTNNIDSSSTTQTNSQQNMRNNLNTLNQTQNQLVQSCSPPTVPGCQIVESPYSVYPPTAPPATPHTYSCVCIPYLDTIAVNQVNMNCLPSQDMTGKDLPEVHSLRFFFNLGIEHYRMLCQGGSSWQPLDMSTMIPAASSMDQLNGNACGQFTAPPPPLPPNTSTASSSESQPGTVDSVTAVGEQPYYPVTYPIYQNNMFRHHNPQLESSILNAAKLNGDKYSKGNEEGSDSGCDSESLTGSANDDSFKEGDDRLGGERSERSTIDLVKNIDNFISRSNDDAASTSSTSNVDFQVPSTPKTKTKRKYYTYGNHKLIKPVKDIPPRFLSLLAESSAARARCEGEPIIIPFLPPKPQYHAYNPAWPQTQNTIGVDFAVNSSGGFNPNAKCFVPGNATTVELNDPSIIACSSNVEATNPAECIYTPVSAAAADVSPSPVACSPANSTYMHPAGNGYAVYVYNSQAFPSANVGDGSHGKSGSGNHSSTAGDGSNKTCMLPSSTGVAGPACTAYPPPCPVYYSAPGTYAMPQSCLPAPGHAGLPAPVAYTNQSHGTPVYSMPPQIAQIPVLQAAQ